MKSLAKTVFEDQNLQGLQDNVAGVLDPLVRIAILDGVQISATLSTGSNRISQPLQATPRGWIIVDRNGVATVYRTAWDSKTISLTASAPVNLQIWIY